MVDELPVLKVEFHRYRQHHTGALKLADRRERAHAVDAWYMPPSEHNYFNLVGFVGLTSYTTESQ